MIPETARKSLVEQVIDGTFDSIEGLKEFDAEVVEKLKELAECGDLTNDELVIGAIKMASGEPNEDS